MSRSNSDPWLRTHHALITQMRPRLLVLNFENGHKRADVERFARNQALALAEGSRYRGHHDARAPVFLNYQLEPVLNLVDAETQQGCPNGVGANDCTSSLAPRRLVDPNDPNKGVMWDYAQMFSDAFARKLNYQDPNAPGRYLTLCELFERGTVHEVWVSSGRRGGPKVIVVRAPVLDAERRPTGSWTLSAPQSPTLTAWCIRMRPAVPRTLTHPPWRITRPRT